MKKVLLLLTLFCSSLSAAKTKDSQVVSVSVLAESSLTVSGNPNTLSVTLDDAGTGSATDSSTTYTVISNASNSSQKLNITGEISSGGDMPDGTSLTISLSSNQGKSQGENTLSTSPSTLVTKLKKLIDDTGEITYTFNVTNGKKVTAQSLTRVITLTLVAA